MDNLNLLPLFDDLPFAAVLYKANADRSDFYFVKVNDYCQRIDQVNKEFIAGESLLECFPAVKEFGLFELLQMTLETGESQHLPIALYKDDQHQVYRENWIFKVDEEHLLVIYEDRDDIVNIYESLDQQRKLAIESSRLAMVGELSASISHELNNPLTVLMLMTEKLRRQLKGATITEVEEGLLKIESAAKRMSKITNSVLSLTKNTSDDLHEIVDIKTIFAGVIPYFQDKIDSSPINFLFEYESFNHIKIKCNPIQIQQVLTNLIKNAIESVYKLEKPWVKVELREEDELIIFSITDSGAPIEDYKLKVLGQKFTTTKGTAGTGLGLYLSKKFIESHQGYLNITNKNEHPNFEFALPVKK